MISIGTVASCDYYLSEASSEAVGANQQKTLRRGKKGGYYEGGLKNGDLLKRPLTVHGGAASKLGLKPGQTLTPEMFKNLYFGHHPATGKPLAENMPSKAEQDERQKALNLVEKKFELACAERDVEYSEALARANGSVSDAMKDPKLVEADRVLAAASGELKSAQNAEGHRRAGIDISFSLPPDINLIHASLLASGRHKEAKDLEDYFTLTVDEACRDLEQYATASAGRSDRDGLAGEPVKCVWVEASHYDARPDPDSVVSHNQHKHRILLNAGLTADGRWVAMRTEDVEAQRSRVDGEVLAKMTRYCVVKLNVDPTATEYKNGVLGVEFGGSRALRSLKEKGFATRLFGRKAQIAKNKAAGMSDSAASRKGRKEKIEGWTSEKHIDMQRELLAESGLTLDVICGNRKEREREANLAAEQKLLVKFVNEEKAWLAYLAKRGFPDGQPSVLRGAEASRWYGLMKEIREERKTPAGKSIPPRPARPPGHPEHKEKTWRQAVSREANRIMHPLNERLSLKPEDIVAHVSQIDPAFTPGALREEISRRIAVQPRKDGLLGAAERLAEKLMSHEQLSKKVTKEIDAIYRKTVRSDLVMESVFNGKKIFVAQDQRKMERELYGEVLPDLLKPDPGVRSMKPEDAKAFIEEWEKAQGFPFSVQQRQTLEAVATSQVRAQASLGWAGSGKSAQAKAAREILNRLGYRVIAVAPSHAAAGVLVKEMGASAGYCPEGLLGALTLEKESLGSNDVVFLDEASMLALRSGSELIAKIRDSGARIILSGDQKQLQSVGAGNVLNKFIELAEEAEARDGIVRKVHMNEVFTDAQTIQRQKLRVSKQIAAEAETGDMRNFFRTLSARGMVEVAADEKALIAKMSKEYQAFVERDLGDNPTPRLMREFAEAKKTGDGRLSSEAGNRLADSLAIARKAYDNTILLAETNAAVDELARNARETLKALGMLDREDVRINGARGKMSVSIGERLVLRGKLQTKDALGEGEHGSDGFEYNKSTLMTVVDIKTMKDGSPILVVRLDQRNENGVDTLHIPAERFQDLAYGYSRTTHLSQGMSAKNSLCMPSKNTRSELTLVGMTRFTENGKIFMVASEIEAIQQAASRQQRKLNALDYDELSQVDLDGAIERTRGRRGEDLDAAVEDAKAGALDSARGAARKPEASLTPLATAIRAAAGRDKRTDVEKAARLGVVRMDGRVPRADKDSRSWLAVYAEKREVFNPDTSRMELKGAEFAVAYDPKTGRIEEWPAEALDDRRLTLARRASMGEEVRKAIRDADKPLESDIKGVLVGTGVAPLKNRPGGKPTPWAEIEAADGTRTKVWGADLGRAIKQGNFRVGDGIALNNDERVNAEVFGSKPIPGGSGKHPGVIVTPPEDGKSGVVRLDDGREVRVFDAPEWSGLDAGARVDVHSKNVERRVWTAKPAEVESSIPLENRLRAWAAVERAIGDDDLFERLQSVGAGLKAISNDSEADARRRAIRTLKANGEGYAGVVDWNANVGTTGRLAWHEAGYLVKDEGGMASASLACVSVLDDGDRIYCCVAVQNQRTGDVEGMATRLMAFDKKALGLTAGVAPGTALEILVSDGSDVPVLAGGWGGLPNTVKTTAQELAERREALMARQAAEDAATVAARNAIFEAAGKMPRKEIAEIVARAESADREMADRQQNKKNAGKPRSLRDVKKVGDLLTKTKEPARTAETNPASHDYERAMADAAKAREAEARNMEEAERKREAERARAAEWQRRTNEETLARRQRDAEEAARLAEETRRRHKTTRLESLDPESPDFVKDVRGLIQGGADAHASAAAFRNVFIYVEGFGDEKRGKALDYLLARCPEGDSGRMGMLIDAGADPEIALSRGYPLEEMVKNHGRQPSVLALYLEKGGSVDEAVAKGAEPVELFANMPAWRSDDAMVLAASHLTSLDELRTAFNTPGADGATLEKRAALAEAAGDQAGREMIDAANAIRQIQGLSAPAKGPAERAK